MKGRTTQLLLFLVGSGIELLVDVNPNDKVSLVKLNVATQLCHKFGFPGAEAISALATGMTIGRLGYDWRNDNPLWMYGVTDDLYGSVFSAYVRGVGPEPYTVGQNEIGAQSFFFPLSGAVLDGGVETGLTICSVLVDAIDGVLANRLGFWFRLPWAWPMLCHPVYGLDVAKRLVQLVENGRLGNGSFEYYKIDCAGVLSTPALWAAVVAFARGTAPLADAACNQSLKIYAERVSFAGPLPRPSRPRRGHHTRHTTHTTNERLVDARLPASRET